MVKRPNIVVLMAAIQIILIIVDLLIPFLSPSLTNLGTINFLMAYGFVVLDFLLVYVFWRGSKWAWFFGLLYSGFNILNYVFLYFSNNYLFYAFPLFLRLVLLSLRSRTLKGYFDISKSRI